jgi:hypothetical protein
VHVTDALVARNGTLPIDYVSEYGVGGCRQFPYDLQCLGFAPDSEAGNSRNREYTQPDGSLLPILGQSDVGTLLVAQRMKPVVNRKLRILGILDHPSSRARHRSVERSEVPRVFSTD